MQGSSDYIQQIAEYIKKNIAKGYTLDSLKVALMEQGYSRIAIERGIERVNKQLAKTAPLLKEKPHIKRSFIVDDKPIIIQEERKGFLRRLFGT